MSTKVGGWLLLLSVVLIFGFPLASGAPLYMAWQEGMPPDLPAWRPYPTAQSVVMAIAMLVSVVAGLTLVRPQPAVPARARIYLIVIAGLLAVRVSLPIFFDFVASIRDQQIIFNFWNALGGVLFALL